MSETKLHNQGIIREVSGNGQQIEAQKMILVASSPFCGRQNIQWFESEADIYQEDMDSFPKVTLLK